MNKLEFNAKDVKELILWLKRFSIIDNTVLIEIDESSNSLIAKSYNEERSVVKKSSVKFDVAGLFYKKSKDQKRIKAGIYSISRLIKILDHFNDGEFTITVNYDSVTSDTSIDFVATDIVCKNDNLKMIIECTPLSIFKYITDDLFDNQIAFTDSNENITFTSKDISNTLLLCGLDSDYKFMDIIVRGGKFVISGKSFNKLISEKLNKESKSNITLYKEQFEKLDVENYTLTIGEDRIIFNSDDSDTVTVLSSVQKDETEEQPNKNEDIF